jgi:hypothetical protein
MSLDRFSIALEALTNKTRLNADQRVAALKAMHDAGLLDSPPVHAVASARPREILTLVQAAANPSNKIRLARIIAEARRLGAEIQIDDCGKVDMVALDRDLRGKDVERRMSLKRNLAMMNLIP